jgi:nucleoside-triphosphatase THEP1
VPMIHVLAGPLHSGKTTLLTASCRAWRTTGLPFDGFLSPTVRTGDRVEGYDLVDLRTESRVPYLRREGEADWERTGSFYFLPDALAQARAIIRRVPEGEVLIVDEFGPLELRGGGLRPALNDVFGRPGHKVLLVVREDILEDLVRQLGEASIAGIYPVFLPYAGELMTRGLFGEAR